MDLYDNDDDNDNDYYHQFSIDQNNFDDNNFGYFNDQENILNSLDQEYQINSNFGIQTDIDQVEREYIDKNEEAYQKCKTEQPKSLIKTMETDPKDFINKKREKKYEKEEDKEPPSDEQKTGSTKVIKGSIFQIFKEMSREVAKGRKNKFKLSGKHNKFCPDNIIRRIKTNLFDALLRFVNASIKEEEIEISEKKTQKKITKKPFLLKINQEMIKNITVQFNIDLLDKKLKIIFSQDVAKKVENYGLDFNKKIIEEIYKEKKQKKTIDILNMTLNQCLEHFRGSKTYKELDGLEKEYKKLIEKLEEFESEKYVHAFKEEVNTYRDYFEKKTPRETKKNIRIKDDD